MTPGETPLDARGLPAGAVLKPGLEISPREMAERLKSEAGKTLLIDCRTREEWDAAHVNGSKLLPLSEIEKRADELDIGDYEFVGVICHHGVRSMKATLALREMGHAKVVSVAGGIDLWSRAVDPGVPRYDKSSGKCVIIR